MGSEKFKQTLYEYPLSVGYISLLFHHIDNMYIYIPLVVIFIYIGYIYIYIYKLYMQSILRNTDNSYFYKC